MSLLMKALRIAEEARRQVEEEQAQLAAAASQNAGETSPPLNVDPPLLTNTVSSRGISLEEREVLQRATEEELEDYLSRPHDLDEMVPPSIARQTATTPIAADTPPTDRQSAATVFSAKAGRPRPDSARTTRLAVLCGIAILLVPAWFAAKWYLEENNGSSLGLNPSLAGYDVTNRGFLGESAAPPATAPNVAETPAVAEPLITTPNANATVRAEATEESAEKTAAESQQPVATRDTRETDNFPEPLATTPTESALASRQPTVAPPAVAQTLEIKRAAGRSSINPQLQEAYALFRAGDLDGAAQRYQTALAQTPDNRDALLGLAAIALQQLDTESARRHYGRLLELNPQDALARTGWLQSLTTLAPAQKEETLRNMLSSSPDTAPLHFALGNLYAGQERWQDAQSAYFNALLQARRTTAEAVNPDYAFNLAISLERLGQSKAAVEYYKEAQNLARTINGSFDIALLNQRLATLEQSLP